MKKGAVRKARYWKFPLFATVATCRRETKAFFFIKVMKKALKFMYWFCCDRIKQHNTKHQVPKVSRSCLSYTRVFQMKSNFFRLQQFLFPPLSSWHKKVQQSLRKAQTENKINNRKEQLFSAFRKTKYFNIIKVYSKKCIELSSELEKERKFCLENFQEK